MEFEVKLNHKNMRREVIIFRAAGLYLEVIDPLKEAFIAPKEVDEIGMAFQLTLGQAWHSSPKGTLYIVERASEHQNRKIEPEEYLDAIQHYCKLRKLDYGYVDGLNISTQVLMDVSELDFDVTQIKDV